MSEGLAPLSQRALALAAVSQANAACTDLLLAVEHGEGHDLTITDVIEHMADAAKLTIEASQTADEEALQLLAALARFLDGWAG